MPRVQQISILPRGISDHAPLLINLSLEGSPIDRLWGLSRFWITDPEVDSGLRIQMDAYWATNPGSAPAAVVWDAFKASSRGHYQSLIGGVRRQKKADLVRAEDRPASLERQYTQTGDSELHAKLQESTREVMLIRTSLTKKKLLQQTQRIFEEGERGGRLLAWLAREQSASMSVLSLIDGDGVRQLPPGRSMRASRFTILNFTLLGLITLWRICIYTFQM